MKYFFKNKLLIILVLIALFITSMCSSVFASTTIEVNEDTHSQVVLPDLLDDFTYALVLINPLDSATQQNIVGTLYFSNSPIYYDGGSTNNSNTYFKNYIFPTDYYYKKQLFIPNTSGSVLDMSQYTLDDFDYLLTGATGNTSRVSNIILYSKTDVYYYDTSNSVLTDEVVFQGAPQVQTPQVELMKATQVEEILPQIIAVVEIVLPIFLGIFGVLLVLYLIKSKNLLHL